MPLPELRRHKRSFVRLATNNTLSRLKDAQTGQRVFVDYLRDQLAQGHSSDLSDRRLDGRLFRTLGTRPQQAAINRRSNG
jgi:hypothetical protein